MRSREPNMQTLTPKTPEVEALKKALAPKVQPNLDLTDVERRVMALLKDKT